MSDVTSQDAFSAVQPTGALGPGPNGMGVEAIPQGGSLDINNPTVSVKVVPKTLKQAYKKIGEVEPQFRAAASQNVRRVLERSRRRIQYAPNALGARTRPRRDLRSLSAKESRTQQVMKKRLDAIPVIKRVPVSLKNLNPSLQENIASSALKLGMQMPAGLAASIPLGVVRRISAAALKSQQAAQFGVPVPRRQSGSTLTAAYRRLGVGLPAPNFG